jgi:hypothetical protein
MESEGKRRITKNREYPSEEETVRIQSRQHATPKKDQRDGAQIGHQDKRQ